MVNCKSHINKKTVSCKIVERFIDSIHGDDPLKYIKFIIVDRLNNVDDLSTSGIDDHLLEKEKLWIGMLLTQHKGMNASHDWRCKTRTKTNK